MKVATWNVNSIRARLDHACDWLERVQPDVLCMQETKVVDDDFPTDEFMRLGYGVAMAGQLSYNGVAILSRLPMKEISIGLSGQAVDADRRAIAATIAGVRIFSVYVPNGKTVSSPSFPEKLAWLERLRVTLDETANPNSDVLVCGDFNIATDERDVYAPELFRGKVHFHPDEHRALARIRDFGLKDAFPRAPLGGRVVQLVGLSRRRLPQERRPTHRLRVPVRVAREAVHERDHGYRAAPFGQALGSHPGDRRARLAGRGREHPALAARCSARLPSAPSLAYRPPKKSYIAFMAKHARRAPVPL